MLPEKIDTEPVRSNLISAPSRPAAAERSMVLEKPKPRSLPCLRDWARRASKPRLSAASSAMPYKTSVTFTYDCGEFEKNMDMALDAAIIGESDAGLVRH